MKVVESYSCYLNALLIHHPAGRPPRLLGHQIARRRLQFTPSPVSDYESSQQEIHHEIECFFATTFKSVATSPYRVLSFPYAGPLPTSKMISSSTGVPSGRLATPYTRRQGFLSLPKTSCSNSEAASATFVFLRISSDVATDTPSRTSRVTLSSDPRCCRATA